MNRLKINNIINICAATVAVLVSCIALADVSTEQISCTDADWTREKAKFIEQAAKHGKSAVDGSGFAPQAAIQRQDSVEPGKYHVDAGVSSEAQTRAVAGQLFDAFKASVQSGAAISSAASTKLLGDAKSRIRADFYKRCRQPMSEINKNGGIGNVELMDRETRYCPVVDRAPISAYDEYFQWTGVADVAINVKAVFSSRKKVDELVRDAAPRLVAVGSQGQNQVCTKNCGQEENYSTKRFNLLDGQPHYFRGHYVPGDNEEQRNQAIKQGWTMTNFYRMQAQPLEICGGRAVLLVGHAVKNTKGFDRGTILGLAAQVGARSLLVTDIELQSGYRYGGGRISNADSNRNFKLPAMTVTEKYHGDIRQGLLDSYDQIGLAIGATESAQNGRVHKADTSVALTPKAVVAAEKSEESPFAAMEDLMTRMDR